MSAPAPSPIPPAVAALEARCMPQPVRDAVTAAADAVRVIASYQPGDTDVREYAIADWHRATKVLATQPQRTGGESR